MNKLEKILADFRNSPPNQAKEYAEKIIHTISYYMSQDKEFIMPVAFSEDVISKFNTDRLTAGELVDCPEDLSFTIHTLTLNSGETVYAAFTSDDEVNKGEPVSTITTKIDHYLEGVLLNSDIAGLFINPFGNSCFLPRDFIEEIFEHDYINSKPAEEEKTVDVVLNSSSAVEEAISFANECHKGTFRKGTDTPYIVHPLEVANILTSLHADYNLMIAGLLHDVVEDSGISIETIKEKYGEDVAYLVSGHSEDKSKVWYARKLKTIRDLPHEDIRSKLLTLGDKLSNIRSMYNDYKLVGEGLWERFNAPKAMQSWYYSGIVDGLSELQSIPACADVYNELNKIYKELFVDYFLDDKTNTLYQISAHGEGYFLTKGNPQWQNPKEPIPDSAVLVTRAIAERTEDNWNEPFWKMHEVDMEDKDIQMFSSATKNIIFSIKNEQISLYVNNTVVNLSADDSHRLLTQFRIQTKDERPIDELLQFYFGTDNCIERIVQFANAVGVNM